MKNKKLKPLLTRTVFLIPTIIVLTGATKSDAMLRNVAGKLGKVMKTPGISANIPKLNKLKLNRPGPIVSPNTSNSLQRPSTSNTSSNSNKNNPQVGIYETFKGNISAPGTPTGLKKKPAYNPNKGPAPKPPKLEPVYDQVYEPVYEQPYESSNNPVYQNTGSNSLSSRPLPPLPSNAKKLGTLKKIPIKNGQALSNPIYENILNFK